MGRDAAGVRGIRLRQGDEVVSCDVAADDTDILIVTDAGYGKRTKLERFNRQTRGGQGVRGIRLTGTRGTVVAAFMVAWTRRSCWSPRAGWSSGPQAREIASQGRDATGVRVMNLDDGPDRGGGGPGGGGDRRGLTAAVAAAPAGRRSAAQKMCERRDAARPAARPCRR